MGLKILIVTIASLLMMGFIDAFVTWYRQFLKRRVPVPAMTPLFIRLIWAVLAVLFWLHLYYRHLPEQLDMSHFLFVSFVYSLKGLITSFTKKQVE